MTQQILITTNNPVHPHRVNCLLKMQLMGGDSDEGESHLEYAQKVCTMKPLVVKPPGMLPTPERKVL